MIYRYSLIVAISIALAAHACAQSQSHTPPTPPAPQSSAAPTSTASSGRRSVARLTIPPLPVLSTDANPPAAPREFRAAWVATVNNGNWPSRAGLSSDQQKKEMFDILDRAVQMRLNCIIFQVRTGCDALYESKLEPWSEFLSGVQGQPPSPYWDPLQTWIDESHKRGLELHAWFNPYRARSGGTRGPNAPTHVANTHPEIVRQYGRNQLWLDPGDPRTMDYSLAVFLDVVRRYDVDGVHIDDYFYPYKVRADGSAASQPTDFTATGNTTAQRPASRPTSRGSFRGRGGSGRSAPILDFPDDPTWAKYKNSGGTLSRNDWRRQNVNIFIQRLYEGIKKEKKWVKFGISPFGIWRPENPPGIKGLDSYSELYADSKRWLNEGWCDYFTPQLYWAIEGPQAFPKLFKWWSEQSTHQRPVWPGINTSGVSRKFEPREITGEINITRQRPSPGHVHWNMMAMLYNPKNLDQALLAGPYASPAITPRFPWLDSTPPATPIATAKRNADGSVNVMITAATGEPPLAYAIWHRYNRSWKFTTAPGGPSSQITLPADPKLGALNSIVLTGVDRTGNESARVTVAVR